MPARRGAPCWNGRGFPIATNREPVMDRFVALQLFNRIVELGSFTEAAEMMNIPRATATYAIKQLESRLGARLLDRTTRQVKPTLNVQTFYERSQRIMHELKDAEYSICTHDVNPHDTMIEGLLCAYSATIILPRISECRAHYPNINVVLSSGDRLVDLVK